MAPFDELVHRLGLDKIDDYVYRGILGEGGQATVGLYENAAGERIAAKIVIAAESSVVVRRLKAEAEALRDCATIGDTVIAARSEVRQAENLPVYFFLMDVARGESLQARLQAKPPPWNWKDALRMVWRITWALQPLHLKRGVHRDLHPGNIFVDESKFKYEKHWAEGHPGVQILDLGVHLDTWKMWFGEESETGHTFRPVGSVRYASPEALNDPSSAGSASDVWSIGVLFYFLLTGKYPFFSTTLRGLMDAKESGAFAPPVLSEANETDSFLVKHFLSKLLAPDPSKRLSIGQLTKMASDVLYFDAIKLKTSAPWAWELFVASSGNMWGCPRCKQLASLNGSMCRSCGYMNDEPLHWSSFI